MGEPGRIHIRTERLVLREPRLDDLDGWAAFMADERSMRYLGGPEPRAVAWRALMGNAGAWALQSFNLFAVEERATGRWVGRVGPLHPEGWPGDEVGWGILREFEGRGYATEAAAAAVDWAFETLGWTDVIHCIDPGNTGSQAVARRIGSRPRGPGRLPAPFADDPIVIWGQTRDEWRAAVAAG
ncbi:MAG: GNAT family N-acetyltransferase [Thermoleophilia bacterium]